MDVINPIESFKLFRVDYSSLCFNSGDVAKHETSDRVI